MSFRAIHRLLRRTRARRWLAGVAALALAAATSAGAPVAEAEPAAERPVWSAAADSNGDGHAARDRNAANAAPAGAPHRPASRAASRPAVSRSASAASGSLESSAPIDSDGYVPLPEPDFESDDDTAPVADSTGSEGLVGRIFQQSGLKFRVFGVDVRLTLGASAEYNSNIFGTNTDVQSDIIYGITPTIFVGIGDYQEEFPQALFLEPRIRDQRYFVFSYAPTFLTFQRHKSQNFTDQRLHIEGQYFFTKLLTRATFDYVRTSDLAPDLNGRVPRDLFTFVWANSYTIAPKTAIDFGVTADYADYQLGTSYSTFAASVGIGYVLSPKTRLTFGPAAGITFVEGGGSQTFENLSIGVEWTYSAKLRATASLGVQARQFEETTADQERDFVTPIGSLVVEYLPFDPTRIALSFSRGVGVSGNAGGDTYDITSLSLSVSQRLFQRITLDLSARAEIYNYQDSPSQIGRTDNFYSIRAALAYSFLRQAAQVSIFVEHQLRDSTLQGSDYSVTRIGAAAQIAF